MLFGMLEEVAHEVTRSQQNVHLLQHLLQELKKRLEDYLWGSKLGSTILWEQHTQRLKGIDAIATTIQIQQVCQHKKKKKFNFFIFLRCIFFYMYFIKECLILNRLVKQDFSMDSVIR